LIVLEKAEIDHSEIEQIVLVVSMLCLIGAVSAYPWNMISAIFAFLSFVLLIGSALHRRRQRKERLKQLREDPAETHFLIPPMQQYRLSYVKQDKQEHHPDELVLPSCSEVDVVVWMNPKLDFEGEEIQLGCEGEPQNKPEPLYYFNYFISEGKAKEVHPSEDASHYRDIGGMYHIRRSIRLLKGTKVVTGIRLRTKTKGVFPFRILLMTTEGASNPIRLTLKVD